MQWRNRLSVDELNYAVQITIDRLIFLRMAEDRGLEPDRQLLAACEGNGAYDRFMRLCRFADGKYNSGLFDFEQDRLTPPLKIDDRVFRPILQRLYAEYDCPYQFSLMPVEILGTVYERFLGKIIRLTPARQARIVKKPEFRKHRGIYYTPSFIVDRIVQQTVARQISGKSPKQLSGAGDRPSYRVLDMACGSGSFLLAPTSAFSTITGHGIRSMRWKIPRSYGGIQEPTNGG